MSYKALVKIACKLLALFTFAKYIALLPSSIVNIIYMFKQNQHFDLLSLSSLLVLEISMMLFCVLLWIFADKLAVLIVKEEPENIENLHIDYDKLQQTAFTVAGLLLFVTALPNMISILYQNKYLLLNQFMLKSSEQYIKNIGRIIETTGVMLLGLWLTLGNKGIVQSIKWLRTAGVKETEKLD